MLSHMKGNVLEAAFTVPTRAELHGVFVADGPGGINLVPEAWAHHRKNPGEFGSPYPAQVPEPPARLCSAPAGVSADCSFAPAVCLGVCP